MSKELDDLNKIQEERIRIAGERLLSSLEQLKENLNPNEQLQMSSIPEILFEDRFYSQPLILEQLEEAGYIECFYMICNKCIIIEKPPYSDLRIVPVMNEDDFSFRINLELVVSKEVEDFIKNSCRKI